MEVLQRPSTGLGDPAPLASHMDNSEEKTCFVPVYFHDLVKKSVSYSRVLDIDALTTLVLLTSWQHSTVKVTRFTSSTDFHFLLDIALNKNATPTIGEMCQLEGFCPPGNVHFVMYIFVLDICCQHLGNIRQLKGFCAPFGRNVK